MNQIDDLKLPQPTHVGWSVDGVEPVYAYTAEQMREYSTTLSRRLGRLS